MATKKAFKPCEGCPTPAKCKAAGKCMAKEGKGGKFMGLALSPKEPQAKPSERSKSTGFDDFPDSDVPFN